MFHGACAAGVDGVQVHFHVVGDVTAHHGTLQEMDVVQPFGDARCIMQILNCAFAVFVAFDIDHVHGSAGGAVVNARA